MSSLASQLKDIAAINHDTLTASHTKRASYLYTPRQAASLSREDVWALADNAFLLLVSLDPRLTSFGDVFLSQRSKTSFDRNLSTEAENTALDGQIATLLKYLGPHLLIRPCAQFLEWLIRQYQIHERNVRDVFCMILPFHETAQFAQMLQILKLDNDPMLKAAFGAVKQSLQPLPRQTLTTAMTKSQDLVRLIAEMLMNNVKLGTVNRPLVGFWIVTLLGFIDAKQVIDQDVMACILPTLFYCIKNLKTQPGAEAQVCRVFITLCQF